MHQCKVNIFPKASEPFSLIVGACESPWPSFAFCVYAVTLPEGSIQHMCAVTQPERDHNGASEHLWILAEGWRRAGAVVDMKAQPHRFASWSNQDVTCWILTALRPKWLEDAPPDATSSDMVTEVLAKVTNTIQLRAL